MSNEESKPEDRGQLAENKKRKPKVSKLAVASLVFVAIFATCAVLWIGPGKAGGNAFADYIFIIGVISLAVSFASGVLELLRISLCKGQVRGAGFAVVGVLISGSLLLVGYLLPKISSPSRPVGRMMCGTNLSSLGKAIIVYASDNNGELPTPENWCDLLVKYADVYPKQFICQESDTKFCESAYAMNINLAGKKLSEVPPDTVLLFETNLGTDPNGRMDSLVSRDIFEFLKLPRKRGRQKIYGKRWNQYGGAKAATLEHHNGEVIFILHADGLVTVEKSVVDLQWEVNEVVIQSKTGDTAPNAIEALGNLN